MRHVFIPINNMCAKSHQPLAVLTLLIIDPICLRSFVEFYFTREEKGMLEPSVMTWNDDSRRDIFVQVVSHICTISDKSGFLSVVYLMKVKHILYVLK